MAAKKTKTGNQRQRLKTLKTTEAKRKKIAKEYHSGASAPDLARRYGIARGTVYAWALEYGPTIDADPATLPTEPAKSSPRTKARPLMATAYACPHCGSPVELPE